MVTTSDPVKFKAIQRQQIAAYARASGDHNRIHLDEDFARTAGLPSVIAHGMMSMGLAATALDRWKLPSEKVVFFEAKFKEKVFPNDQLMAEFVSREEMPDSESFKARIRWVLKKSTGEEVLQAEARLR